jgi:hypothetical protein
MITKSIIFWLSFLISQFVDAQESKALAEERRICMLLSDMTFWVAEKRDQNVGRFEIRQFFLREAEGGTLQTLLAIADLVYQKPHYPPQKEADNFFTECMQEKGDPT